MIPAPPIWTLSRSCEKLAAGHITSEALTEAYLARIKAFDGQLHCVLRCTEERALGDARASDQRRAQGALLSPLDGIPIALKDLLITQGIETTAGSRILAGYRPPYQGTIARRLEEAGTVLLGKLNMDAFAMGSSNEHSGFGPCHNPWALERVPGGSSGGAAAAVSAALCAGAIGTDTGGSIRQPAAFCGVTGLRPTYGRVSRYGMIAFASSLDQAGPIAHDVKSCALLLQAIAGHDPRDATSVDLPPPSLPPDTQESLRGLRIGIPEEYFVEGSDPQVLRAVQQAIATLEAYGARSVKLSLPTTSLAVATYVILATAEASSNLARYDGIRYGAPPPDLAASLEAFTTRHRSAGFGDETTRRILLGTFVLSRDTIAAYLDKAQSARIAIQEDFAQAFSQCDLLATPTTPTPAFWAGTRTQHPLQMALADLFTTPSSLANLPGLSLPCGHSEDNLPIGLQLLAPPFAEDTLLRVGAFYQAHTDWHLRRPPYPPAPFAPKRLSPPAEPASTGAS